MKDISGATIPCPVLYLPPVEPRCCRSGRGVSRDCAGGAPAASKRSVTLEAGTGRLWECAHTAVVSAASCGSLREIMLQSVLVCRSEEHTSELQSLMAHLVCRLR